MFDKRKVDLNKSLTELTKEGITSEELLAAYTKLDLELQGRVQKNSERELNQGITNCINEFGITVNLLGYQYLRYAIKKVVRELDAIHAITKRLYREVTKEFGMNVSRVERTIRHAVEVAWNRGDSNVLQRYFGHIASKSKGKPTSSEFIAQLAEHIRMKG